MRLDALKPEDGSEEVVKALYRVHVPDRTFGDQHVPSTAASVSTDSGILLSLSCFFKTVDMKLRFFDLGYTREEC